MPVTLGRRRVILVEFNEINVTILDPLIARGKLPNFQRLRREGAWSLPESVDLPPHMDPWITWITVHTGVDRSVHGATVLGQDSIQGKLSWEYATDAGQSVGVFGSIGAYPPPPVRGFVVPSPFAPTSDTVPRDLQPIQDLNRTYTQVHSKNRGDESPLGMIRRGVDLFSLGLRPQTCATIARQLLNERLEPTTRWKRVALQPLVNYDFFEAQYRRHRPDYATWHTNHAAHFMHHYWRAMDDSKFLARATEEERRIYGGAVEYGYQVCDDLLGRFMSLAGTDTTLVVASSMGQQPYVAELFPAGRIVVRVKDMNALLRILGAEGVEAVTPLMVPQWGLRIPDDAARARVRSLFESAYTVNATRPNAFSVEETGVSLTISPSGLAERKDVRYFFPEAPNADPAGYPIDQLFALDTETPKEGMHHPTGVLGLWGKDIRAGVNIPGTTNLDIAPTLLTLLGIPVPPIMTGRVLGEAWGAAPVERPAVSPLNGERPSASA